MDYSSYQSQKIWEIIFQFFPIRILPRNVSFWQKLTELYKKMKINENRNEKGTESQCRVRESYCCDYWTRNWQRQGLGSAV